MHKKIILALLFFSLCSVNTTWAWNDKVTHRDLSEKAVEYSILSPAKGDYLKNLGFDKNIKETFTLNSDTKTVQKWIGEGGVEEDAGNIFTAYYYHHFHDPLALSWNQAGLSTYYPLINGMSSILWAQNTSNPWNWQKAREYYYTALTGRDYSGNVVAADKTQRDAYFAKTFKGLGHIIHLIQDVAQPAHVRNDPHPLDDNGIVPQFENWTKNNRSIVSSFMSNPVFFGGTMSGISSFFDTDQYTLTTGPNATLVPNIGLAEYTGANFLSEDTMFVMEFPYPSILSVQKWTDTTNNRQYLKKPTEGVPVDHLAVTSFLYFYRLQYFPQYNEFLPLVMDSKVYSDYASLLLPRAVGYSASLINYFFRGQINMEKDPNDSNKYIIKNLSNEPMSGVFSLYYDDTNGNRYTVQGGSWNLSMNAGSQSVPVTFTEPTEAKEKGKYILVFQGILGNEKGAVIGRVVTLSRPLYLRITLPDATVVYWNIEEDKEVKLAQAKPVSESPFLPRFYNTGKIDVYTQVVGSRIEGPHFKVSSSCYAVETDDGLIRYVDPLYEFLAGVTQPFLKRSISFSGGGSGVQTLSWRDPDSFEYRLGGCSVSGETGSITEIITNDGITGDLHDLMVIERSGARVYFGIVGSDTITRAKYFPGGVVSYYGFVPSDDIRERTQNFEVFSVTGGVIKNRKVTSNIASYRSEFKTWLGASVSNPWNLPAGTCWVSIPGSVYYGTPTKYYLCDSTAKYVGSRAAVDFQNSYVTKNSYHPTINWIVTKYGVGYYNYEWQNGEWVWVGPERKPEIHIRVDTFEYNGTDLSPVSDRLLPNLSMVFQNNPKATLNGFVEGILQE